MLTLDTVQIDPTRGLAIIDVDEVLALFVQGFAAWLTPRGVELRLESFSLLGNMHTAGDRLEPRLAKTHLDAFFAEGCGEIAPAPGAAAGLAAISGFAQTVILTNAPEPARALRSDWLERHGMPYPMILNAGLKGPAVASLAGRTRAPALFVDDLLPNLESVAEHAPAVARYQMIADPALRAIAPTAPDRHRRVDDWPELVEAARVLFA